MTVSITLRAAKGTPLTTAEIDGNFSALASATNANTSAIASLGGGGPAYTLPAATASTLGGIKIGSGLSIDGSGVVSAAAPSLTSGAIVSALGFTPANASSVVSSFNTRTGAVTLTSGDVTSALGFTPVSSSSAATGSVTVAPAGVASGSYPSQCTIGSMGSVVLSVSGPAMSAGISGNEIILYSSSLPYMGAGCVHPYSEVTLSDGSTKFAVDVRPGDQMRADASGGTSTTVLGIQSFIMGVDTRWFVINGTATVTSSHPILLADGRWAVPDVEAYMQTIHEKRMVLRTTTGFKHILKGVPTLPVTLEAGMTLAGGTVVTSIDVWTDVSHTPVINIHTTTNTFVADGVVVAGVGTEE